MAVSFERPTASTGNRLGDILRHALAVWRRQQFVWRQLMLGSFVTNVCEPILFLFAFGFGLGAVIDEMEGLSYLAFIVAGIICYTVMFSASFETSIGSFARYQLQKTWDGIIATPVTLSELLLGEALWAATKALFAAICVMAVGGLWGRFAGDTAVIASLSGALLALPCLALGAWCFACCGLAATSMAKSWEFFSYYFTFWVSPMFVFGGVFFSIERFPWFIQAAAWLLPMPHMVSVVRPLTTGQAIDVLPTLGHLAYLLALSALAFWIANKRMAKRMFD